MMIKVNFRQMQDLALLWGCRLVVTFLGLTVVTILASLLYLSSGLLTKQEILLPVQLPNQIESSTSSYQEAISVGENKLQLPVNYLVDKSATWETKNYLAQHPEQAGTIQELWLPLAAELTDNQALTQLQNSGKLRTKLSLHFFTNNDSRSPSQAGIKGSFIGSILIVIATAIFAVPIGCAGAIWLVEFAPPGRLKEGLEVLINNLAAVPSIVFGLLGYTIFIELLQLPRASALVAGLVLAVMILPIIVVSAKLALQNVPTSLKEAALSLGASHLLAVFHHVVPAALPAILNGVSIALIRALGETAPLLVIGMAGFLASSPASFTDPSSALPLQIYTWAVSPEPAFVQLAAGAVLVLISLSVLIHLLAKMLKHKFSRR